MADILKRNTFVRTFNKKLDTFLDDLQAIFPNEVSLCSIKEQIATLRENESPDVIIESWYGNVVLEYGQQIAAGNLDFFLTFKPKVSTTKTDVDIKLAVISKLINNLLKDLGTLISQLTVEQKAQTVKNLQMLKLISDNWNSV